MRKFAALALILALTGCSAQEPVPIVTPVDLKYCALSDSAGFNDDGLNRSVYAALQQLKIQAGASLMAIEVGAKLSGQAGIQKLVDAKCNVVITSGDSLVSATVEAAKVNVPVKFYSVSDAAKLENPTRNFVAITFNIYQAAFAAGYLAAEVATSGPLENQSIAIIDKINTSQSRKSAKAFTFGVARFNTLNRENVAVSQVKVLRGDAITFALAGSSEEIGSLVMNSSQLPQRIIGYGRDWYEDPRNSALKSIILTSVVRVGVIDKVVAAVTTDSVSQNFDLASGQVGLVAENEVAFPRRFATALDAIIKDLGDGKVKVG